MAQQVRILNTGSLLELSRRLRAAGGENIRQSMHRRIRRAAEPLKDDLQASMRGLTIRPPGRTTRPGGASPTTRPLRDTIADAIRISVRTGASPGATVWVDKSRLPADLKNMPEVLNEGRVRHPVFGNRRRWVNQWAQPPWWDTTVRRHTPRIEREVARVLDDVRRRLE
ncbi:hypothetical protein [Streptomyces caniscabiei]|uniref:HK97 gp10 family phage protein n=1 Tax=Streptomyces caniscabiei TaxID=2746961 RepID=A0ABU4MJ94_9ACTN|nr:hypothetical protein [Streptomyces caniscabiei]MBE4790674.1 hypothetical protein [Streptomyces caniscabiei]MBE4790919.1 hypothetical protein [Streptomyces caniscabiei]MDX2941034.1 hypothetical protein [Streptomyces caniscabiei]MDX2953347.1 hypothetical protein [Streptomyces caniscabiei]MDX2987316.1 hypothetical protein [Streptomyces caniscabiei]